MVPGDMAIYFPKHQGIKCYAMLTCRYWLVVEGVPEPVLPHPGDCFILPRGLPFRPVTDLSLETVLYTELSCRSGSFESSLSRTGGTDRGIHVSCATPVIAVTRSAHMEDACSVSPLLPDRSERLAIRNFDGTD